ncbi:hypothetical protein MMC34_002322 [Xylographa carneopallida]|nr:hypothetical protein [Xylographa carneopallida]
MSSRWNAETSEPFHSWNTTQNLNFPLSWTTLLAYGVLAVLLFYYILQSFHYYPLLYIPERVWKILVYMTPSSLVVALDKRTNTKGEGKLESPERYSSSRTFAAKSEAMKHILGLDGASMLSNFQRARSLPGMTSIFKEIPQGSLPGLGNWDNSCYQNSVIQSLAALASLSAFLAKAVSTNIEASGPSTVKALKSVLEDLNNPTNAGQRLWTPPELKTMSSWQQQDAQEYYSKVLDQVDKEASKFMMQKRTHMGLRKVEGLIPRSKEPTAGDSPGIARCRFDQLSEELAHSFLFNPLEGLLAQRVGCLKCGFVEGLSLIPFNCLTLPLGRQWEYDLENCLDEYTALESINGVECSKCTLLRHREQLQGLLRRTKVSSENIFKGPSISEALHLSIRTRLSTVCEALENEDFSEVSLTKKCQIPAKSRVDTTKSKQAVIARLPKALTIHVNRSVFNERTGVLSKNQASVRFPKVLDLTPWCLGNSHLSGKNDVVTETWNTDPSSSMLHDTSVDEIDASSGDDGNLFILRAVITHYGRHENGHYICYRRNPQDINLVSNDEEDNKWWRLSDEEVSEVCEDDVLDQGGVFMLFYERLQATQLSSGTGRGTAESSKAVEAPTTLTEPRKSASSNQKGQQDLEQLAHEDSVTEGRHLPLPHCIPQPHPHPILVSVAEHTLSSATVVETETSSQKRLSSETHERKNPSIDDGRPSEDVVSEVESPRLGVTEKEDRKVPPPMRTAGARSFDRPDNGMASISSMVTAN